MFLPTAFMGLTVSFQILIFTKVEICLPTAFMGFTVQPCRELSCSAVGI
jgi:hypothetical protein